MWMAGNANLPDRDWNKNTVTGSSYKQLISQQLLETMHDINFEQVVNFPTRGANTLKNVLNQQTIFSL